MAIVFAFDDDGGFIAGDTATGRTSYAYPTSHYATCAKRAAMRTAILMMRQENESGEWRDGTDGKRYDSKNWSYLPTE